MNDPAQPSYPEPRTFSALAQALTDVEATSFSIVQPKEGGRTRIELSFLAGGAMQEVTIKADTLADDHEVFASDIGKVIYQALRVRRCEAEYTKGR